MSSRIIIGIDDTDNLTSRGTGFIARELSRKLQLEGLLKPHSVVRHQLLRDERIPFTSHNSAASISGIAMGPVERIISFSEEFLYREAASGSDAGLCIAREEEISFAIEAFGLAARAEVLDKERAHALAEAGNIHLRGLTGSKIGVIGALAAAGLRKQGNDGRLLWMENLRETCGIFTVGDFRKQVPVDEVTDLQGTPIESFTGIEITEWCRPVMKGGRIILFAEKIQDNENHSYRSASKEFIKSISE